MWPTAWQLPRQRDIAGHTPLSLHDLLPFLRIDEQGVRHLDCALK